MISAFGVDHEIAKAVTRPDKMARLVRALGAEKVPTRQQYLKARIAMATAKNIPGRAGVAAAHSARADRGEAAIRINGAQKRLRAVREPDRTAARRAQEFYRSERKRKAS